MTHDDDDDDDDETIYVSGNSPEQSLGYTGSHLAYGITPDTSEHTLP